MKHLVLVVEDDDDLRAALFEQLRSEGYEVSTCANGREALGYLQRSAPPDVILLDLMMPVMDGWEFRVHQRRDSKLAPIPVVVLSADRSPQARAIDADAVLTKPVDFEALTSTVSGVLLARENVLLQARLAQADRLTALGTLAAGVAHEINNPLAYLMLNLSFAVEQLSKVDTADRAVVEGKVVAAIANAQHGAERIRTIVSGLKTFSSPEKEDRRPLSVSGVIESVLPILAHEIECKATLERDYAEVPPVDANEGRLAQVFLNLLLNATQARVEGKDNRISVRTRHVPPNVVVEVEDTGSGIPEEICPRIFEPFFTTKPVGVGTGLGLPICHGIVRSLGGEIEFSTTMERGSVFRVLLPAAPPLAQDGNVA